MEQGELLVDDELDALVVVPGDVLSGNLSGGWLRGHGTFVENGSLLANVGGAVERVNRLVSVRPVQARFVGEVGDVVVGRVKEVGSKRWRVDVRARQDGVLMLSAVNLAGGVQRRRTYEDQLAMRTLFREDDLISAEVHSVFADGSLSLHARSLKYGKLENGVLVCVSPGLVKRLKQHFLTLRGCNVDVILGLNGCIWLTESISSLRAEGLGQLSVGPDGQMLDVETTADAMQEGIAESIEKLKAVAASRTISNDARARIARVKNSLLFLSHRHVPIDPESIMAIYTASLELGLSPSSILHTESSAKLEEALI